MMLCRKMRSIFGNFCQRHLKSMEVAGHLKGDMKRRSSQLAYNIFYRIFCLNGLVPQHFCTFTSIMNYAYVAASPILTKHI